ncbi:bile acid:sodium symporter family protein [Wenyingzhuangia sp. chi5]|uniref:Bile acid:sodium symporter family protein n=1 Tax=Wenyingzhuangia gilva TaxID=3057677 RepID=A0ABT8VU79_9FLAO|nr:bile acid:sodium symporter family protein [Wenyingzhuangia sp. chi5]MDO3695539.1 bile acid:sodium symporter family protein [Wenyingzhuangia sp. chi5]
MKIDKFVICIVCVVIMAYLFPQYGSSSSSIPLDAIGSIGISLIFFFYGVKLSPDKIKSGLKNWKLHILVQLTTFLIFPIFIFIFYPFISSNGFMDIWIAFLFLAALPSTVSSSVVMVSIAKGNIPAAIFNASISGLIGILVTPLWMGMFLNQMSTDYSLTEVYLKLLIEVVLPVVLGGILQKYLGTKVSKYNKALTLFDKSVILLIIYKSFSESFEKNVFSGIDKADFFYIILGVSMLFYGVYFFTGFISDKLKFNREDKITAQFCGTKKSLVHGTIFSKILFQNAMSVGFVLLPLMMFHALQILVISIIATKLTNRKSLEPKINRTKIKLVS